MKKIFTASGQHSDEFSVGGDTDGRSDSRFRVLIPDMKGSAVSLQLKASDESWINVKVFVSSFDELGSVIDSVHAGVYRLSCGTYGGTEFSVYYKE